LKYLLKFTFILVLSLLSKEIIAEKIDWQTIMEHPDSFLGKRNFYFFPSPIVYYTPETKLAYGLGFSAILRNPKDTVNKKPSTFGANIVFTQNKQRIFYAPYNIFLKKSKFLLSGEINYSLFNYYFYGIGQNLINKEKYNVDITRILTKAYFRPRKGLYAGFRFNLENYRTKDLKDGSVLASGIIPYANGSLSIGLGPIVFFDHRDVFFYPSKGYTLELGYLPYSQIFGSKIDFYRLNVDFSSYHSINKNHIIAQNIYFNYNNGFVPFNLMSTLGGQRRLRGYYEGYYRDYNTALYQLEYRYHPFKLLGFVAFAGIGFLGNKQNTINFNYPKYSAGGGIRFAFSQKDKLNLRLDYAVGQNANNFYFTIGEAF